jgi:hypothetical protein
VIEIEDVLVATIAGQGRLDQRERRLPVAIGDGALGDLTGHVAVDRGKAGIDAIFREIVEPDVESRERTDMGNAAAHLSRADDANRFDLYAHRSAACILYENGRAEDARLVTIPDLIDRLWSTPPSVPGGL